tara:strand:+ start:114 stop:305 length:192 start_codon:yes stop_codon:yes gene_type:complete
MDDKKKMMLQKLMAGLMRGQSVSGPAGGLMTLGADALDMSADYDSEERRRKEEEKRRQAMQGI